MHRCTLGLLALAVAASCHAMEPVVSDEPDSAPAEEKRFYSWNNEVPGKRKFYSWAGKRSASIADAENEDVESPEKRKFYSWAGKRSDPEAEKRKFYSWAGKRADPEMEPAAEDTAAEELTPDDIQEAKRKFYSWAGKRSDPEMPTEADMTDEEKRKFYSWAGKRAYGRHSTYDRYQPYRLRGYTHNRMGKRKFYSWAGKRADPEMEPVEDIDAAEMQKRKFYSWAGK